MVKFLLSREFWFTSVFLGVCFLFNWADKLSSYIQDLSLYGLAYAIWGMDRHNTFMRSILQDPDKENKNE